MRIRISWRVVVVLLLVGLVFAGFQQLGSFMRRMQMQALQEEAEPAPAGFLYEDRR